MPGRLLAWMLATFGAVSAHAQTSISLPGERVFPENIAASRDGTLYVGSVGQGGVFRIEPHGKEAKVWIKPGAFGTHSIFGVLADDKSNTLWVCSNDLSARGVTISGSDGVSALKGFDLKTGEGKISAVFPGKPATCNDITIGPDGSAFVSNTAAPQILRLAPGVAVMGKTAWVSEGQLSYLFDPDKKGQKPSLPFQISAVALPATPLNATSADAASAAASGSACAGDSGGVVLSPGFCATVFADNIGHARHLVVAPNGVVYVNTWSGRYYENDKPPAGGFLVALQDTKGTGKADVIKRFGDGVVQGSAGGTGIQLYKGAIYAEVNDRIVKYALDANAIVPTGKPEVIVSGMPLTGDHPMHPFIIDAQGNLFVDLGSATNACEVQNRMPKSPGNKPCTEKETRAGTWKYDANKTGQQFSPRERYATGIRNGEGFGIDADGRLFVTQHGRDQLSENWPGLYKPKDGPELPAEEVMQLQSGADYGWPECYFDGFQKKLVLAPEYGGDGGKTVGLCAQRSPPAAFFPAHWAPNDLLFVTNNSKFPAAYRKGAFIAFHGSWNRAPAPQGGYNVVFQPMAGGKAVGEYVIFADGFAGAVKEPGRATARPSGLAAGPDGSLYISDDTHGRIWRVTYQGAPDAAKVAAAPAPKSPSASSKNAELPPEGVHPDAGRQVTSPPPGATKEQVALGDRIFHGEAAGGTCGGCHGSDERGSPVGADLTSGPWLWSDGSFDGIAKTITEGVPHPRQAGGAMPPFGGTPLKPDEVKAVAAYVYAVSRGKTQ